MRCRAGAARRRPERRRVHRLDRPRRPDRGAPPARTSRRVRPRRPGDGDTPRPADLGPRQALRRSRLRGRCPRGVGMLGALLALAVAALGVPAPNPPVPLPHGTLVAVVENQAHSSDGGDVTTSALVYQRPGDKASRPLYSSAWNVRQPAVSPSRVLVAFTCIKGSGFANGPSGRRSICVEDLRTQKVRTLGLGTSPSWSPDSRRLAFVTRYGVGTVDVTGRRRRIVVAAHARAV